MTGVIAPAQDPAAGRRPAPRPAPAGADPQTRPRFARPKGGLAAQGGAGLCASEGGAATADVAAPLRTSLAALLTRHILRDGEVVLLILKPSLWYIAFASMRFFAAALIVVIGSMLWVPRAVNSVLYAATFIVAGRVMWAVLQWMGRLYVLTDLRVLRLSGVFNVDIVDCALRKVAQSRVTRTFREKLWRLGSIEIVPVDDSCPASVWQTVKRPDEVHAKVQATIERAKQGHLPCGRE